jgi:transcriptional regulator with XRE-family HTH domain
MTDEWGRRLDALGAAIRQQRQLARMSLRQLSELAHVSNPYLSQIERGLHEPSMRVVRSIARALNLSAEELLERAGMLDDESEDRQGPDTGPKTDTDTASDTEAVLRADPHLTVEQREALIAVYRSYRSANRPANRPAR